MRTDGAGKLRGIFIVEFAAVLASLAVAYITHWRIPLSAWIAVPAGLILWLAGFLYTMYLRKRTREAREMRSRPVRHRGYPMVEARAAMHLGVALGFRSWPTLVVAVVCAAVNFGLAMRFRRKLKRRIGDLHGWPA